MSPVKSSPSLGAITLLDTDVSGHRKKGSKNRLYIPPAVLYFVSIFPRKEMQVKSSIWLAVSRAAVTQVSSTNTAKLALVGLCS